MSSFQRVLPAVVCSLLLTACAENPQRAEPAGSDVALATALTRGAEEGREIFRFDDFGSWRFWTDTAGLHELIEAVVSPEFALETLGLKVDGEVVTAEVLASLPAGALQNPETTVLLLSMDAVVGLKATVEDDSITRVGITCALCHSTVDDAVAPGIGTRQDGWPNRDLDVGLILANLPGLEDIATALGVDPGALGAAVLDWGPGFYDARLNIDGRIGDPAVLIPPAYGLRGVGLETYTGEGPISYWNNYVAVTQMRGHGSFRDPRLDIDIRVPPQEDEVRRKLAPLRQYQFTLETPPAPPDFDPEAAERGEELFRTVARCSSCHIGPRLGGQGRVHAPEATGMEATWADRGTTGGYRATPLRALWQHPPYFHDGFAETLEDVVEHYDEVLGLGLSLQEKEDLVQYLLSI